MTLITPNDTHELVSQKEDGFQAKFVVTANKEILEGWAKVFKNQYIVVILCSEPTNRGNADTTCEASVDL